MQFAKGINRVGGLWETIKNIADSLQANVQSLMMNILTKCTISHDGYLGQICNLLMDILGK